MSTQERAARTRRALIRAAALVFAERGYAAASLGEVSSRAAVSPGALHFHFANKQDLAQQVDEAAARVVGRIAAAAAAASPDPLRQLVDSVILLAQGLLEDPLLPAGFELGYSPRAVARGVAREAWAEHVIDLTRRAERAARLGPGISARAAAETVLTMTAGLHVMGRAQASRLADDRVEELLSVLLAALGAPAATIRPGMSTSVFNCPE